MAFSLSFVSLGHSSLVTAGAHGSNLCVLSEVVKFRSVEPCRPGPASVAAYERIPFYPASGKHASCSDTRFPHAALRIKQQDYLLSKR